MALIGQVTARLEMHDPGYVRTRRGARAVCATVLAWGTMAALMAAFDVPQPLRITLFAAGAAFEGALLAPDPRPIDRVRTLGWAAVVCAAAVTATVWLSLFATWAAAAFLVLLMFSSYALRQWSPRLAGLALIGAITVYVTGAGHITVGRIGWFVLAAGIGLGWLALWETLILPDTPLTALRRSVGAFSRRTGDTVAGVTHLLGTVRAGPPPERARRALQNRLDRVRSCRAAIERQLPGVLAEGMNVDEVRGLRVALHAAQKALEDMAGECAAPGWMQHLPDDIVCSTISTLHSLATALRDDVGEESRDSAARTAEVLRSHVHDAIRAAGAAGSAPFDTSALLSLLVLLEAGETVAQSVTQATSSTVYRADAATPTVAAAPDPTRGLSPTMALGIQAVTAALAAGAIATLVGNDQRLVVAWTAFVVIAGSAGHSARRAWVRLPATLLGAVAGVMLAAFVPDTLGWTIGVVAIGVFCTIVSAPVSYPAMVFWMSIAFVPLFASAGNYLDVIWDKTAAALIGGCVAAVVSLTVLPIRSALEVRPAVLNYLDALDVAIAAHGPGRDQDVRAAEAELDSAYGVLTAKAASAATETNVFAQPNNVTSPEATGVDAVHDAYLRLTPLLSDSSRALHGWSDQRVATGVRRLRAAIDSARAAARGDVDVARATSEPVPARPESTLGPSDSIRRIEVLHARIADLAGVLGPAPDRGVGGMERA